VTEKPAFPPYPQPQGLAYAPPHPPLKPPPIAPDGRPLAGFGGRFVAKLIDNVVVIVGIVVGFLPFLGLGSLVSDNDSLLPVIMIVGIVIVALGVPYLYDVEYAWRRGGQTLGKRAMKMAIVPLQPGAPLTRAAMAKRWGVAVLFNVLASCYIGYLDPLWMLWDKPYRQCLHDKAAGTTVVLVPPA